MGCYLPQENNQTENLPIGWIYFNVLAQKIQYNNLGYTD